MKRIILSFIAVAALSVTSMAQVEIKLAGSSTDISGGEHNESSAGAEVIVELHIENHSGGQKTWAIKRDWKQSYASWTDYFCWGPLGGIGQCYGVESANPWTSTDSYDIADGAAGDLQVHIKPNDPDFGTGIYRYYIMNGSTAEDSVDIIVNKIAGIEGPNAYEVSIAPNPANEVVHLNVDGIQNASVKLFDVLGNVAFTESAIGAAHSINTARMRNGVYFVVIEGDLAKPITRKIIIRH